MGTETILVYSKSTKNIFSLVKLNNPLMGTETALLITLFQN